MQRLYSGLAEILEINESRVTPNLVLADVAWDSLAIVSAIALVDECFGIVLDGQSLSECVTVADIEALVARRKKAP